MPSCSDLVEIAGVQNGADVDSCDLDEGGLNGADLEIADEDLVLRKAVEW